MFLLNVDKDGVKFSREFESKEMALLYRDYEIFFGKWSSSFEWVNEEQATSEQKKCIIREKNAIVNGVITKQYLVPLDIKIELVEKKQSSTSIFWQELRAKRDLYLQETDWTQLSDSPLSTALKKDYRDYRNYLRILPTLHNDSSIAGARVCSFLEWRNGER